MLQFAYQDVQFVFVLSPHLFVLFVANIMQRVLDLDTLFLNKIFTGVLGYVAMRDGVVSAQFGLVFLC